jgi:hypothetical protein
MSLVFLHCDLHVLISVQRASIEFPFVRYYGDEDTPFRYNPDMFMTSTNEMGIKGSSEYGGDVYPAEFEPACDAYAHAGDGRTTYNTRAGSAFLDSTWQSTKHMKLSPSLMHFIKHATNQPLFGLNGMCNHQWRMFNTVVSVKEHAPRPVQGAVRAYIPSVSETQMLWTEAAGVQVSSAFVEKHMIPCEEMRNWTYKEDETDDEALAYGNFEL